MNRKAITLVLSCLILIGTFFVVNNNMARIYVLKANYYFKKNNMVETQKNLEKAFVLGFDKSDKRDLYVNSIINSPLTIESQGKLIKFLDYPKDDDAKRKVQYFLYDLKHEILKKYSPNYISQAAYNQKIVRWNSVPITYDFVDIPENIPEYFKQEVEKAFLEIEKATAHQILFAQEKNFPHVLIKFYIDNPADEEDYKYVAAYTTTSISINKLKNTTMNFYLKDSKDKFYEPIKFYNIALHEIIHSIGLMGHSYDRNDVMYYTDDNFDKKNVREKLTHSDVNSILLLYKIKPDITNSDKPTGEYLPYIILGDEDDVIAAKSSEAKHYVKNAPTISSGYIDLAETYMSTKDYHKVLMSLKKALTLAENDDVRALVYYNLAVAYYSIDEVTSALEYAQKSKKIKNTEELQYLIAEILLKQGNIDEAIKEYEILISLNPHNIEYAIALTNIYVSDKKYLKARKVLKNYIKNNPQDKSNTRFKSYGIIKIFI